MLHNMTLWAEDLAVAACAAGTCAFAVRHNALLITHNALLVTRYALLVTCARNSVMLRVLVTRVMLMSRIM